MIDYFLFDQWIEIRYWLCFELQWNWWGGGARKEEEEPRLPWRRTRAIHGGYASPASSSSAVITRLSIVSTAIINPAITTLSARLRFTLITCNSRRFFLSFRGKGWGGGYEYLKETKRHRCKRGNCWQVDGRLLIRNSGHSSRNLVFHWTCISFYRVVMFRSVFDGASAMDRIDAGRGRCGATGQRTGVIAGMVRCRHSDPALRSARHFSPGGSPSRPLWSGAATSSPHSRPPTVK